ncbi:hypothetical protein ACXET9_08420 [Brachybacterium sp. DNPG3]
MRPDDPRFHGALISRARWLDLGFHARDLAGPDFTTVFHGHLTPTDHPAPLEVMARVAQQTVAPGALVSHSTAAVLMGMPLPAAFDGGVGMLWPAAGEGAASSALSVQSVPSVPSVRPGTSLRSGAVLPTIHLRTRGASGATRLKGIALHRGAPGPVCRIGEMRLSSPVEVLRELAQDLPLFDLVAVIDAVIGRRGPVHQVGVAEIQAHLERSVGRRGIARLRAAVARSREDVRSPGETVMRLLIEDAGLPSPDPNLPVFDPETGRRRFLDLAWRSAGFALEYDGDGHRTAKDQWRADENRRDELAELGWLLARANGKDLRYPLRILLRIARALAQKGLVVPSDDELRAYVGSLARTKPSLRIAASPSRSSQW